MADRRRLPPLDALEPFEAAVRHGNFTRAAEELHFSQATVSRRVAQLEADLGVQLFVRGRHDVQPTPAARELASAARLALEQLADTAARLRRRAGHGGTLTIYSDLTLTSTVIVPIIGDIRRRHGDIDVRVLSSFEPITSTREDFDVGVQYGRDESTSLVVEAIADDEVFPVCSPELATSLAARPSADELADIGLLHVDYGEPAWTDWAQFLAAVGASRPARSDGLRFTSYAVCLDTAERGEGLALGWGHTVQPRIDAGRLIRVPGFTVRRPDAIRAYRPAHLPASDLVDEFITRLRLALNPSSA